MKWYRELLMYGQQFVRGMYGFDMYVGEVDYVIVSRSGASQ